MFPTLGMVCVNAIRLFIGKCVETGKWPSAQGLGGGRGHLAAGHSKRDEDPSTQDLNLSLSSYTHTVAGGVGWGVRGKQLPHWSHWLFIWILVNIHITGQSDFTVV